MFREQEEGGAKRGGTHLVDEHAELPHARAGVPGVEHVCDRRVRRVGVGLDAQCLVTGD